MTAAKVAIIIITIHDVLIKDAAVIFDEFIYFQKFFQLLKAGFCSIPGKFRFPVK